MRIWNKISLFVLIILFPLIIYGENLYVRSGASGNGSGSDWNNAWSSFSAVAWGGGAGQVGAGDTLWVAGGTYSGGIDINSSGTSGSRLFIKRALASESACTSATGWSAAYDATVFITCDGTVPSGLNSGSGGSYVTVDGGVAYTGFTFNLDHRSSPNKTDTGGIVLRNAVTDFTIRNAKIDWLYDDASNTGSSEITGMQLGAAAPSQNVNVLVEYVDFENCVNAVHFGRNNGITIQYCKFHDGNQTGTDHSNIIYAHIEYSLGPNNFTFRYNLVYDNWNEGVITGCDVGNCPGASHSGWYIYGNVFYRNVGSGAKSIQFVHKEAVFTDVRIHYNTFVGEQTTMRLSPDATAPSGTAYNNLMYNNVTVDFAGLTHDFTWFSGSDVNGEANGYAAGAANPFVNSGTDDYRLSAGTTAGTVLTTPGTVAVDLLGISRSTPDRGAYEFDGTPAAPVISSNNITGTNGVSLTYQISANGSPTSFDATNLPPGLSVNTSSGVISGTPTQTETNRTVGLKAVNGTGTTWQTVLATIHPAAGVLWLSASTVNFGRCTTNTTTQISVTASNAGPPTTTLNVTFTNVTGSAFSILNGYTNASLTGTNILKAILQYTPTGVGTNLGNVRIVADGNYTNNLVGAARPVFTSTNIVLTNCLILLPFEIRDSGVALTNSDVGFLPVGIVEWEWEAPVAGNLQIWLSALATNLSNDSLYFTVDTDAASPTNVADILPYPAYLTNQSYIHWRGGGSYGSPEFSNKTFSVSSGRRIMTIAGRETQLLMREANIVFAATGGSDTTSPTVTIQYPTNGTAMTVSSSQFTGFAGIASDNNALLSVIVTNVGRGVTYTPTGTTTWTNGTISLFNGLNTLKVIATDTNSNTGSDTLDVYFNVPSRSIGQRRFVPH